MLNLVMNMMNWSNPNSPNPRRQNCYLEVLKKHLLVSNKLIEDQSIRYQRERGLIIGDSTVSYLADDTAKYVKELIEKGVLIVVDSEGHMKIKSDLSNKQVREIEWIHIEIMSNLYPNLFFKKQHFSDNKKRLSNNWYYYIRYVD